MGQNGTRFFKLYLLFYDTLKSNMKLKSAQKNITRGTIGENFIPEIWGLNFLNTFIKEKFCARRIEIPLRRKDH